MPRKRPTESSWDSSDEDLLKDDTISLNAYPLEKEMEDFDEDELLGGSDEEQPASHTHIKQVAFEELGVEEEADLIHLEVEGPDDLEESVVYSHSNKDLISESHLHEDSVSATVPPDEQTSVDYGGHNSMLESFQEEPSVDEKFEEKDEDSESENEDDEDSRHRGRFRTERPTVVRLPSSQPKKADIPDTLEISKEDQEKIEEFMHQKPRPNNRRNQRRGAPTNSAFRFDSRPILQQPLRQGMGGFPRHVGMPRGQFRFFGQTRMANAMQHVRPGQMFGAGDGFLSRAPEEAPGHKILINPHFRGGARPQQEPRGSWEPNQGASNLRSTPNSFQQQQQMLSDAQSPPQHPTQPQAQQPPLAQYRPLMSFDLTQRPPQFTMQANNAMQRPLTATPQRHFVGVPQNFASTPQNPVQAHFQQSGVRPHFPSPRGQEPAMFQQPPQSQTVIQSAQQPLQRPPQPLQRPTQFIQGQQPPNLQQHQSQNFSNPPPTQHQNFPPHIQQQQQQQMMRAVQQPNVPQSRFPGQPQPTFMNQSFRGPPMQQGGFRLAQPPPTQVMQPPVAQFVQQAPQRGPIQGVHSGLPPQASQNQTVALMALRPAMDGMPGFNSGGNTPRLMHGGFPAGSDFQQPPQHEEIVGQPIETVVDRQVQSRNMNNPAAMHSNAPGAQLGFNTNKLSPVGQNRQQPFARQVSQEMAHNVTQAQSEVMEESADLELKQRLEERARRFAQPAPALSTTNTTKSLAQKRLSDTPVDHLAPLTKQAKLLAIRKPLTKAAVLQKRRAMAVAQSKSPIEQRISTEQKMSSANTLIAEAINQEYDSDLQRGLEQQRLLRERVLKMKEQRRLQQAGLRRKELEQRLRAEGLTGDQIQAKLESDTSLPTPGAPQSGSGDSAAATPTTAATPFAGSIASQPTAAAPVGGNIASQLKVATPVGKKPTKTIVVSKAQYKAMVEQMRIAGQSKGSGQQVTIPSSVSLKLVSQSGTARPPSGPLVRGPRPFLQPRSGSAVMLRPQNPRTIQPRTAVTASGRSPGQAVATKLGAPGLLRAPGSGPAQPRRIVQPPSDQNAPKITPANLSRRVVIGAGDRSLMSSLVSIEGLALSTTPASVRQLAEKTGPVQHIQYMSSERKALVRFHNPDHAVAFSNRFNRHMLDLSMISVSVVPP